MMGHGKQEMTGSGSQDSEKPIESKVSWDLTGLGGILESFIEVRITPSKPKIWSHQAQKDLGI